MSDDRATARTDRAADDDGRVADPDGRVADPDGRVTHISAGPGGVMTDDVGVVTGELTLRTDLAEDGQAVVRVQYRDADEWYTVTGGRAPLADPADLEAVHAIAVGLLDRPSG